MYPVIFYPDMLIRAILGGGTAKETRQEVKNT